MIGGGQAMIYNMGAKHLMAAILESAYTDYHGGKCRFSCPYLNTCTSESITQQQVAAKSFILSKWCEQICDGLDISWDLIKQKTVGKEPKI